MNKASSAETSTKTFFRFRLMIPTMIPNNNNNNNNGFMVTKSGFRFRKVKTSYMTGGVSSILTEGNWSRLGLRNFLHSWKIDVVIEVEVFGESVSSVIFGAEQL